MGGTITASPTSLTSAGSSCLSQIKFVDDLNNTLKAATSSVTGGLGGVSQLSSASSEVEQLYNQVLVIMGCLNQALTDETNSLQAAATAFETTDKNLATMFSQLDNSLQPYLGFEPPVVTTPQTPHHSGWSTFWHITAGVGLSLAAGLVEIGGGGPEDPLGDAGAVGLGAMARSQFGLAA